MKSRVTKVTKLDKQDSYGNTTYVVEFENLDKGFYTSKSADQNKFVVGQEAEYEIEQKIGKTGKEYFKVTLPKQDGGGWKGGGGGRPAPDPRVQMISFTASYVKDLVIADKVKLEDFEKAFNRLYQIMTGKL